MNTYGPLFENSVLGNKTLESDTVTTRQATVHPLDKEIMRCTRCGFNESGLSARLRYFDHPEAPQGFEVKHCPKCGGTTQPLRRLSRKEDATTGQQLKEKGIREVSEHNENWMEECINFMRVAYIKHEFTGEDIRFEVERLIGPPRHPNAYGALINTLIKRKIIVPTGEHRKMKDSRSHARSTPVYKAN